jgi:hypothetical protein
MKSIASLVFFWITFISANGQSYDEIQFKNYNEIEHQYKSFKKIKDIKAIITAANDAELMNGFKKYRRLRYTHQIFARIRDFGLFYGVINESFRPRINPIPLAIGFGSMGGEILTRKRTKKALEELVDDYNSKILSR